MSPAAPALDHDVARWLPGWAEARPNALAWADDHRRCDYATASDRVARLAAWLAAEAGVGAGDRIALWLGNRGATLEGLFAAAHLGAIALPVNARLTPAEVAFQLDDCEPKLVLVEAGWRDRAAEATALMAHAAPRFLEVGGAPDAYEAAIAASAPAPLRATDDARRALERWILIRGPEAGPLFNPVNKGGRIERRRLSEQAIYIACQKRAAEAGLPPTSPEDLRRADASLQAPASA